MHKKESVIDPLFADAFNIVSVLPIEIDTDLLGTFSGDIKRIDTPIDAARKKCLLALEVSSCDLAIASEGSFGPHPTIPFVAGDEEIVVLIDKKNELEIIGRTISTETNFGGEHVVSLNEALEAATRFQFPTHGLIIRDKEGSLENIFTGIQDPVVFEKLIVQKLEVNGSAWIETDMRAMFNPARMKVITEATQNLIAKMKDQCPSCHTPGFAVSNAIKGLPCSMCNLPTQSTLFYTYSCIKCNYTENKKFPHSKEFEEPMYCDFCNP